MKLIFYLTILLGLSLNTYAKDAGLKPESCLSTESSAQHPTELSSDFSSTTLMWSGNPSIWIRCRFALNTITNYPLKLLLSSPAMAGEVEIWHNNHLVDSSLVSAVPDQFRNQPRKINQSVIQVTGNTVDIFYHFQHSKTDQSGFKSGLPGLSIENQIFQWSMHEVRLIFFFMLLFVLVFVLKYHDENIRRMRNTFYAFFALACIIIIIDYPVLYFSMSNDRLSWMRAHTFFMVWEIYFLTRFIHLIIFQKNEARRFLLPINTIMCLVAIFYPLFASVSGELSLKYFLQCFGIWGSLMLVYALYMLSIIFKKYKNTLRQFYWPGLFIGWLFVISGFMDVALLLQGQLPAILPLSPDNQAFLIFPLGITLIFYDQLQNKKMQDMLSRQSSELAIGRAVRQIAHDIKSPLVVLDICLRQLSEVSAQSQELTLLRKATGRIHNIAQSILDQHHQAGQSHTAPLVFLYPLLTQLLEEKRLLLSSSANIKIDLQYDKTISLPFVHIKAADLLRVLSNLINNAIEATSGMRRNKIVLTLATDPAANILHLSIQDSGKGIPAEILPQLFEQGFTHGKKQGHGLGLYNAKQIIEGFGGKISLSSSNEGTLVAIQLPLAPGPRTYRQELNLLGITNIVVIDDDVSIHELWMRKLKNCKLPISFHTGPEILNTIVPQTLVLCDFEFTGKNQTGLGAIAHNQRADATYILVTGNYNESLVHDECSRLNVGLIPKDIIEMITIS